MKIVSWNVNGIRALTNKMDIWKFIKSNNIDILCLQETRCSMDEFADALATTNPIKNQYMYAVNPSVEKKGYAGTGVIYKSNLVQKVWFGNGFWLDFEGRILTLATKDYFIVNTYVINSKNELVRLEERLAFDKALRDYIDKLKTIGPVIVCGDMNVAHTERDIANPNSNHYNPGFSDEERNSFSETLQHVDDIWRLMHNEIKYTWWSYRGNALQNNVGWRIDYFLTDPILKGIIKSSDILDDIHYSDHCPISLEVL